MTTWVLIFLASGTTITGFKSAAECQEASKAVLIQAWNVSDSRNSRACVQVPAGGSVIGNSK